MGRLFGLQSGPDRNNDDNTKNETKPDCDSTHVRNAKAPLAPVELIPCPNDRLELLRITQTEVAAMRRRLVEVVGPRDRDGDFTLRRLGWTGKKPNKTVSIAASELTDDDSGPDSDREWAKVTLIGGGSTETASVGQSKAGPKRRRIRKKRRPGTKDVLRDASMAAFDCWQTRFLSRLTTELRLELATVLNTESADDVGDAPRPLPDRLDATAREQMIAALVSIAVRSTDGYSAYSRVLLEELCTAHLDVPTTALVRAESWICLLGSLPTIDHPSGSTPATPDGQAGRTVDDIVERRIRIGIASVLGGIVVGLAGGLTAPFLAAGIGTALAGLGLSTSTLAGTVAAAASSPAMMAGAFGTYGGGVAGRIANRYGREVRDFGLIRLNGPDGIDANVGKVVDKTVWDGGPDKSGGPGRSLRMTIFISGWLLSPTDVVEPWIKFARSQPDDDDDDDDDQPADPISHDSSTDAFALRWELDSLVNVGREMLKIPKSAACAYARHELLKRTVFHSVTVGLWPLVLVKVGRLAENPFSIATARSDKAGAVLADVLATARRPVTLVGFSFGARVVMACLDNLSRRPDGSGFGIVDAVVVMGAPVPADPAVWTRARAVVVGRLVNVFSPSDWVLRVLYRTSAVQSAVAGLGPVTKVARVENVDASAMVRGHDAYRACAADILSKLVRLEQ